MLQLYADGLTTIVHQFTFRVLKVQGLGSILRHEHHIELAILQHTIELAITFAKGNRTRSIIVRDVNGGILPFS